MDKLGGHYAKWNESDRERQILHDIIYVWNLKKIQQTSEYNKKRNKTHRFREWTNGYQWGKREGGGGNIGEGD